MKDIQQDQIFLHVSINRSNVEITSRNRGSLNILKNKTHLTDHLQKWLELTNTNTELTLIRI